MPLKLLVTMNKISEIGSYMYTVRGTSVQEGALPSMSYIRMCRCEGYGFQAF